MLVEMQRHVGDVSDSEEMPLIEEEFECIVCANLLYEPIVIPTCGHTCCKHCLERWIKCGGVTCPAGCKTKLQAQIPATSVFIRSRIEKAYPQHYKDRKQEVEEEGPDSHVGSEASNEGGDHLMRQNSFSNALGISLSSTERATLTFRVFLVRCKRDGFYRTWRFWVFFACIFVPLSMVLHHFVNAKPDIDVEQFDLFAHLRDQKVPDSVADLFQAKTLHFFLKFDELRDFKEIGVLDPNACEQLLSIRNTLLSAMHVDFFEWRNNHFYAATFLMLPFFWFAHAAVPFAHLCGFHIPYFSQFLHQPTIQFGSLVLLIWMAAPEVFLALFFLRFSYTNPVFTFIGCFSYIALMERRLESSWHYVMKTYLDVRKETMTHLSYICRGSLGVCLPMVYILPRSLTKAIFFCFVCVHGISELSVFCVHVILGIYATFKHEFQIPTQDAIRSYTTVLPTAEETAV